MKKNEIEIVRELAKKVRELSELEIQEKNRRLWKAVNDKKMIRPTIMTRDCPKFVLEEGTQELNNRCEAPFLKSIESTLLRTLYDWEHLRGDNVVENIYRLPVVAKSTGFGLTPAATNSLAKDDERYERAVDFEPIIKEMEDIEKIETPVVSYDEKQTMENLAKARDVLDGILDVKLFGNPFFRCQLWDNIFSWTGIEEGMYHLVLKPDFLHALADRHINAYISQARQYEALGILSTNNTNLYTGAGGYGYTDTMPGETESGIGAKLGDMWGQCQDQIFTSVSPAATKEFAFEYEKKFMELYNSSYYGCCEAMHNKVRELETIKNVRKISVSPFADKEAAMEAIGDKYVVSFKANNLYLAGPSPNYDLLEKELREVLELAKKYNCHVEILMKTIINLRGEPQRLWKYMDMAAQIVESY